MIGYLLYYKEADMPLIMESNISQITTTTPPKGPYPFHKVFHEQIAKWLAYVLDSLTITIFQVLNQRRGVVEDLSRGRKGRSRNMLNHVDTCVFLIVILLLFSFLWCILIISMLC